MKLIASIWGHYEILKILQLALFLNVFQKRKQCFDPWVWFISLTRCELDCVTIEMTYSNNFTHEPLWVVTHTACLTPGFKRFPATRILPLLLCVFCVVQCTWLESLCETTGNWKSLGIIFPYKMTAISSSSANDS